MSAVANFKHCWVSPLIKPSLQWCTKTYCIPYSSGFNFCDVFHVNLVTVGLSSGQFRRSIRNKPALNSQHQIQYFSDFVGLAKKSSPSNFLQSTQVAENHLKIFFNLLFVISIGACFFDALHLAFISQQIQNRRT